MTDIIGYMGMFLIVLSFMMKNVKWIRLINMSGAIFSLTYGIITHTLPTAILNGSLFLINLLYFINIIRNENIIKKEK